MLGVRNNYCGGPFDGAATSQMPPGFKALRHGDVVCFQSMRLVGPNGSLTFFYRVVFEWCGISRLEFMGWDKYAVGTRSQP